MDSYHYDNIVEWKEEYTSTNYNLRVNHAGHDNVAVIEHRINTNEYEVRIGNDMYAISYISDHVELSKFCVKSHFNYFNDKHNEFEWHKGNTHYILTCDNNMPLGFITVLSPSSFSCFFRGITRTATSIEEAKKELLKLAVFEYDPDIIKLKEKITKIVDKG